MSNLEQIVDKNDRDNMVHNTYNIIFLTQIVRKQLITIMLI